jgi:hypothetical protein
LKDPERKNHMWGGQYGADLGVSMDLENPRWTGHRRVCHLLAISCPYTSLHEGN